MADYLGKKKGLALCALCFALSSVGMLFAADLHQFVLWRVIGGLAIGAASVISPNYIAEIAPTRIRGRCVTLYQLGIVVGILAAVFVDMLIQGMGMKLGTFPLDGAGCSSQVSFLRSCLAR